MFPTQVRGWRLGQAEPPTLGLTILASFGGLSFALLQGWPLWVVGGATVIPWLPLFARDVVRTYQAYQWLALFYVLVVTQTAHFLEHVAQMIQIHVLGLTGADARGIFGSLDIEWVHFLWNTWVLVAVAVLLWRFGANRWLWLTALLSSWHELEHAYILFVYLTTRISGTPGLLAQGGAIAGGVALSRPDLHFLYNLVETVPLVVAFLHQVRCTALFPARAAASPARKHTNRSIGGHARGSQARMLVGTGGVRIDVPPGHYVAEAPYSS